MEEIKKNNETLTSQPTKKNQLDALVIPLATKVKKYVEAKIVV